MEVVGVQVTVWNCLVAWVVIVTTYLVYDWLRLMAWRKKYNLKGPLPLPFFANFLDVLSSEPAKKEMGDLKKYGPVLLTSSGRLNCIHIFDFDLVKKIFIQEHMQFQNRFNFEDLDPKPLDAGIMALKDDAWKRVRSTVIPTFSSGKIKPMMMEINFCAELLVKNLIKPAKTGGPIEIKNHFGCYTMDVIAGTAFGIRTFAYTNPDQPFIHHAKRVFGSESYKQPSILLAIFFPYLCKLLKKYLGFRFIYPPDSIAFFSGIIDQVIEERKRSNEMNRVDMIGIMINAQKNQEQDAEETEKKLSRDELMAMGFIVFVAGYETTSSLLTFFAYAMATNPDVQEKLNEEINTKFPSDEVKVKYEDIADLPYLDQVICETLRMYPPIARMNRTTSHDKDVLLDGHWFPKKTMLAYSIWHFHHDPELYEDPYVFKPERFTPEEKQKRDPVSFMPFGHGPRNCMGMRLALFKAKIAVIHVLKKMKFVKCQETDEPLDLSMMEVFLRVKKPVKLGVKMHKDGI